MTTASEINELLPWLLRRENVARYEDGVVWIGDRRRYPFSKEFVRCDSVEAVARAIETMVTQGGGPWVAAAYAMAMVAHQERRQTPDVIAQALQTARQRLVRTRPTNTALARRLADLMQVAGRALQQGNDVEQAILAWIETLRDRAYEDYAIRARFGADLMDDGDGILTMCFAETAFILSLAFAQQQGKHLHVYTPETRPYLQGARLTAPSIHELDIPVTLITDNMPAYLMSQGKIQKYFTAADLITLDGHVVNKIGTFQNAITAHYHGIPYFAFMWGVDRNSPDRASIVIEERDPREVRRCREAITTSDDIPAYYPAFDITPPHLVAGIITHKGVLSPYDLANRLLEEAPTQSS